MVAELNQSAKELNQSAKELINLVKELGSTDGDSSAGTSNPDDTKDNLDKKKELLVDLARSRYDGEWQRTRDLDGKAGNLIQFVSIVTGLLVGLGTFSVLEKLSLPQYAVPFFIGVGYLLTSIIMSLVALLTMKWQFSPGVDKLEMWNKNKDTDAYRIVAKDVVSSLIQAVCINFQNNERKAALVGMSWFFLIFGIGAFVIYIAVFAGTTIPEEPEIKITVNGNTSAINQIISGLSGTTIKTQ